MICTVSDLRLNQTMLKVMSKPFEKWTLPTTLSIVWVRMAVSKSTEPLPLSYQMLQGHLNTFAFRGPPNSRFRYSVMFAYTKEIAIIGRKSFPSFIKC